MKKRLIISIMWLYGTHWAFGQCGSAHSSDLDGSYVSSTSTDPCSGGGHVGIAGETKTPVSQHSVFDIAAIHSRSAAAPVIFFGHKYTAELAHPLILINRTNQIHDTPAACL